MAMLGPETEMHGDAGICLSESSFRLGSRRDSGVTVLFGLVIGLGSDQDYQRKSFVTMKLHTRI